MEGKRVFESWKEISVYLNRSYKTLRRLEREAGLPVHRLEDSPKARVFAYKEELDRWLEQAEGEPSLRIGRFSNASLRALIILPLLAAGLVWGLVYWRRHQAGKEAGSPSSGKPSLAILCFENIAADEGIEYLRTGLPELLISDLSQSIHLNVLRRDEIDEALKSLGLLDAKKYSPRDMTDIAEASRVDYILCGSFIRAGDELHITVYLIEPRTGETLSPMTALAKGEGEIFQSADVLARNIKENLSISEEQITADVDREARLITTGSPEAFRCFVRGKHYNFKGEYDKAIDEFERALEIDPEFAMAYREMAFSYEYMGKTEAYLKLLEKAFSLTDRLTDREQLLIRGEFYRWRQSQLPLAMDTYDRLLAIYPDDVPANYFQGENCIWIEDWDRAIERLECARRHAPEEVEIYDQLVRAYMSKGEYEEAREALQSYLEMFQDNSSIRRCMAQTYLYQGKYDVALVEVDRAISLDPEDFRNALIKGDIYHFKKDLARAEKEYRKLLEMDNPQAPLWGRNRLGCLYMLKGQFIKAMEEVERGLEYAENLRAVRGWRHSLQFQLICLCGKLKKFEKAWEEQRDLETRAFEEDNFYFKTFSLLAKGYLCGEMGWLDEAQGAAERYKNFIERGPNRKAIREYYALMGLIELKRGNLPESIEYSKRALSLVPSPSNLWTDGLAGILYTLAQAYYMSGEMDQAEAEFKKITNLVRRGIGGGDLFAKSHYMLGQIYEQKGWEGKAIENYQDFLSLWSGADPGLPEVEDTWSRLAGLLSQ
jgi:tetratricopeptide (TPR) repeat protein